MPAEKRYTFAEHDLLGRGKFANFLYQLIESQGNYRRDFKSAGYTIAIDAAYGAGKTYFLKMFQSMVQEKEKYQVVYYNAWEHDLYEDALTPILSLITEDEAFAVAAEDHNHSKFKEKAQAFAGHAAAALLPSAARAMLPGILADGAAAGLGHLFEKWGDAQCAAYSQLKKSMEEMKDALQKATYNSPLIFIVDELDRCSPTFAIKTLEVIKHLLNVEGVTFVLAVDMKQLCAAVKKFYGQEIDADGYICKIFDYVTMMPNSSKRDYIIYKCKNSSWQLNNGDIRLQVLDFPECTLRIIDSLFIAFEILFKTTLSLYQDNTDAYELYFYCLFLKFCHRDVFDNLVRKNMPADYSEINHGVKLPSTIGKFFTYSSVKIAEGNAKQKGSDSMLFSYDLNKFHEIKHLTYGQYIHQQLEMFNYVMPTENSDA